MDYGYRPSEYINDFSWIGEIGNTIAKYSTQVPELLKLNRAIKENNKLKEATYSTFNSFIDRLADDNPDQLTTLALNMGITVPNGTVGQDAIKEAVKTQLKSRIPNPTGKGASEETTNESYIKNVTDNFVIPLFGAASNAKISIGDMVARYMPTLPAATQATVAATPMGQEALKQRELDQSLNQKVNKEIPQTAAATASAQLANAPTVGKAEQAATQASGEAAATAGDPIEKFANESIKDSATGEFAPALLSMTVSGKGNKRSYLVDKYNMAAEKAGIKPSLSAREDWVTKTEKELETYRQNDILNRHANENRKTREAAAARQKAARMAKEYNATEDTKLVQSLTKAVEDANKNYGTAKEERSTRSSDQSTLIKVNESRSNLEKAKATLAAHNKSVADIAKAITANGGRNITASQAAAIKAKNQANAQEILMHEYINRDLAQYDGLDASKVKKYLGDPKKDKKFTGYNFDDFFTVVNGKAVLKPEYKAFVGKDVDSVLSKAPSDSMFDAMLNESGGKDEGGLIFGADSNTTSDEQEWLNSINPQ